MRTGKVFALTWDDIDLENKKLTVNKNILKKNQAGATHGRHISGKATTMWFFGTCKTKSSYRTIDIGDTLVNALKEYKKEQEENKLEYGDYYMKHYAKAEDISYSLKNEDVVDVHATDSDMMIFGVKNIINVKGNIVRQFMEIAEEHDIDIGDHASNASTKSALKSDCLFCKLLAGKPVHEQAILYESKNFLVIPGSGAFLDGYIMILPKPHVMSCAELDLEQRLEMLEVINDIKFILSSIYKKDVLVWENGSGLDGKGKPKTSIVHAHIHACPSTLNVLETTNATDIPVHPISFEDLPKFKENSYLLIMDYDRKWYISYNPDLYIPRQYVRQLIAMEHNINGELWNWRKYPFWDNVEKTGKDFLSFVKNNYGKLNTSIKKATEKFI